MQFKNWPQDRVQALFEKIGSVKLAEQFIRGELKLVRQSPRDVAVPAVSRLCDLSMPEIRNFVAADAFTPANAITDFCGRFTEAFKDHTEAHAQAWGAVIYDLARDQKDIGLACQVAGSDVPIPLGWFFHLLQAQSAGQEGPLNTKTSNLGFVRDARERLWTVEARHRGGGGGWQMDAYPFDRNTERTAGTRVIVHLGFPDKSCWDTLDHD